MDFSGLFLSSCAICNREILFGDAGKITVCDNFTVYHEECMAEEVRKLDEFLAT